MRVVGDTSTTQGLVCVRHLSHLGAAWDSQVIEAPATTIGDTVELRGATARDSRHGVSATIVRPPLTNGSNAVAAGPMTIEPFAQATSGLMAAHGRDHARPRRLGLDIASHAAGILGATALVAGELARRRGGAISRVETSTVRGALTFLTHHTAIATCAGEAGAPGASEASGPPFVTRDGVVFELEAASRGGWTNFWADLGVDRTAAEGAWDPFASRYNSATCSLPPSLYAAVSERTFARILAVAAPRRISICRQRGYDEVQSARDWIGYAAPQLWPGPLLLPAPWHVGALEGGEQGDARSSSGVLPLSGVRVVETTHGLPGPLAGQLLRMLGADVTRIEPPGGDPGRALSPLAGGVGAGFLSVNRAKTVVELDYKSDGGRAALAALATDADVFINNWLPGRAEALGFDAATLSARNPALVHTTISGWRGAADTDRVGIEYFVQADTGCADGLSPLGSTPAASRLIICGVMAALLACEATVAALCDRELSRHGHGVETSLYMGAMALQGGLLQDLAGGTERGRRCGRPVWSALDQPLRTADGYLAVAADEDAHRRFRQAFGLDASAADATTTVGALLATGASREWEARLQDAGIACVVVRQDLATMPLDVTLRPYLEQAAPGCWVPGPPWVFQ